MAHPSPIIARSGVNEVNDKEEDDGLTYFTGVTTVKASNVDPQKKEEERERVRKCDSFGLSVLPSFMFQSLAAFIALATRISLTFPLIL